MKISLFLKNSLNKKAEQPVYIRITHKGKSVYISTQVSVKKNNWDKNKKKVLRSDILHMSKNKRISAYYNSAENVFLEHILKNKHIDIQSLKNKINITKATGFFEFSKNMIDKKQISESRKKTVNYIIQSIKSYKSNITLEDINHSFFTDFSMHLKNKGLRDSSIKTYIDYIKSVLNEALKQQVLSINTWSDFKYNVTYNQKPALTKEEVNIIKNIFFKTKNKTIKKICKLFLFSVETGVSLSDLHIISYEDIKQYEKGFLLQSSRFKTKAEYRVPLSKFALFLIDYSKKRQGKIFVFKKHIQYSMQKLKEETKGKIKTPYTFHTARHTFATNLAGAGVSEKIIMAMMGHKDTKSNRVYAEIRDHALFDHFTLE